MGLFDVFKGMFKKGPKTGQKKLPIFDLNKRFELIGRTGQGSMSKVWRARDRNSGKVVCLKILDKLKTAKFEQRFAGLNKPTEGEICLQMRHPNIVQTFEYGMSTAKEPFLVMEYIEGVGLNFLIETKSAQLSGKRIDYLSQLADGVDYIHRQGFLHRDLCPRNVMVSHDGVVKIIDLGLAIPYRPEFCRPGNRTGTTNYLAPELIKRQNTDKRVDMFSLGVTAYETFLGQLPWDKGASQEVLLSMMNSTGTDPRDVKPDIDDGLNKFLKKAIERDPRDRYQNPAEFKEALNHIEEPE